VTAALRYSPAAAASLDLSIESAIGRYAT